jgi:hypothetical protein
MSLDNTFEAKTAMLSEHGSKRWSYDTSVISLRSPWLLIGIGVFSMT